MKKVGRPSLYNDALLAKARTYLDNWEATGDPVPMLCGMAVEIGVCKQTVSKWRKDEGKEEFNELCARVEAEQERVLLQKGLTREHDNSLTKLMLMRHGYNERTQVDMTSSDGTMSPAGKSLDDFYED